MLGAFRVFIMRFSAYCIQMKPFHIMREGNVSFNKLPALFNAFILMFVSSSCMLESLLDTGNSGMVAGGYCGGQTALLINSALLIFIIQTIQQFSILNTSRIYLKAYLF